MATLLHIDSSAFAGEASTSRLITKTFRRTWLEENPGGEVIYRDLAAEPVPHITAAAYTAGSLDPAEHTEEQARAFAGRLALIEELEGADAVVIGAPMYNFTVSSSLKAWLDHVILLGRTAVSPESKVKGTPVTVVTTRGGSYAPGTPREPHEHVLNYLESVLSALFEMEPTFIVADLTLASHIPSMAHLVPLGEQSRANAFEAVVKAARAA